MSEARPPARVVLAAKSPFELRVDLGKGVPEADVRTALATGDMGFLHSFTTGSAVDGPGVRVVAWTAGCMWRCLYCHNPDTWTMTNGIPVTIARATEEIGKYRHGLKVMSGGFTLSGGEALMQHRFAVKLLTAVKGMGIHTALDTNGYYGERLSDDELKVVDLVLLDLKGWDPERHRTLTGMEVAPTLAFARRLAALREARLGSLRARPGPDRRSRRRRGRSPRSRRSSGTSSGWTSCPSIRWAVSSGRRWASTTSWGTSSLRRPRRSSGCVRRFGRWG